MATDQVKRFFEAALKKGRSERPAYLDGISELDPDLRNQVESLLAAYDEESYLDKTPGFDSVAIRPLSRETEVPDRVGPYRILRDIGEGGMGVVYEAVQAKPVRRKVALKLIKWGMDTKEVVARFESERQALALMNHPNIASVFDAGATDEGRPYFAMEYVHGIPITEYCDKHRMTIQERLELFILVCEGVQHAHHKGIIHRDIKPSNVLVAVQDDKPVPKIIDFGVAKATSQRLTEHTVATELGQLIGTPEYMSPEQAEMTNLDIDTRTDVYSLGVLLYELLVGAQPFDATELRKAGLVEIQRKLREDEPERPSTKVGSLGKVSTTSASNRRVEVKALESQLRGDLDWIAMKALEKDRTRRYETANALALDITRYLDSEPIQARAPSAGYKFRKFVNRHKVGVAAGTGVVGALVLGLVLATVGMIRAREAERIAALEAATSEEVSDPGETRGNSVTAREILDLGARGIEEALVDQPEVQARMMLTIGTVYTNLGLYGEAERLLEEAVQTQRSVDGDEDRDTLAAINQLGTLRWYQGRFRDAESLYLEVLGGRARLLGEDDPATLQARFDLASTYHAVSDLEKAAEMYSSVLEAQRRVLGETHDNVAATLNNLASVLLQQQDYKAAEPIYRESLAISTKIHGKEHPDVAQILGNLALLVHRLGDLHEAETLYRETLELKQRLLGFEHPEVSSTMQNLAKLMGDQGDYGPAERLYRETLIALRMRLGAEHPDVAIIISDLAELLDRRGEHQKAEPLHRQALQIMEAAYEPPHWRLADAKSRYGGCLTMQGDYHGAEDLLLPSSSSLLAELGETHSRAQEAVTRIVLLYEAWGKPEKAAEYRAVLEDAGTTQP